MGLEEGDCEGADEKFGYAIVMVQGRESRSRSIRGVPISAHE